MANFEGVLAGIPGYGGYLAKRQLNQQEENQGLSQAAALQGILAKAQEQQQTEKYRGALSSLGPNATPEELLGAARPFMKPDQLATMITSSQNQRDRNEQTKMIALQTLGQRIAAEARHASEFAQTLPIKERQLALQEIRTRSDAAFKAGTLEIQQGNYNYNVSGNLSGIQDVLTNLRSTALAPAAPQAPTAPPMAPGMTPPPAGGPAPSPTQFGGLPSDAQWLQSPEFKGLPPEAQSMILGQLSAPGARVGVQVNTDGTVENALNRGLSPSPQRPAAVNSQFGVAAPAPVTGSQSPTPQPTIPLPAPVMGTSNAPQKPKQLTPADAPDGLSQRKKEEWVLQQTRPSIAGAGTLTPQTLEFTAKQYLAGDRQAVAGFSRSATSRIALQNAIIEEATKQGMSPSEVAAKIAEYAGTTAGSRTVGQRAANISLAATEAEEMIGIVREASDKFGRTSFVPFNVAIKAYESGTGEPEIAAFGASLNALVNVYARAINPTGVPTVSDKEHARAVLNTVQSPEQVNAVLRIIKQELEIAKKAPGTVREAIRAGVTGNNTTNIPEFATEAEAAKAGLKPGTKIKIGGRQGTWQ